MKRNPEGTRFLIGLSPKLGGDPAGDETCGRMSRKVKLGIRLLINCRVKKSGPLAQLEEQVTLNHPVAGSSPARLTILFSPLVFSFPNSNSFVPPLLKNQSDHAWPAGFLLSPTRLKGYNIVCGDGEDTTYAARPLLLNHQLVAKHKRRNEPLVYTAPFPLPEYVVEVLP